MCFGGGGGSSGGNDMSYWANIQRDRDNQAAWEANQERERQRIAKEQAHRQFEFDLGQAKSKALTSGQDYFKGLGYNVDDTLINKIIDEAASRIPIDDNNPAQYLTSDIFDAGINKEQGRIRTKNTGTVNSQFAPGFDRNAIGDTSDDAIIQSILDEQVATAKKTVDYNKARGLLNDSGYSTATDRLNSQSKTAYGTLDDIGQSVLAKGRTGLKDIVGEAGNAASSWSFGSPDFDLTPYIGRADSYANDFKTNLEGKVRSAVGNTKLFDVPTIISDAGIAQGPMNLTTQGQDQAAPFDPRKKIRATSPTGGTF